MQTLKSKQISREDLFSKLGILNRPSEFNRRSHPLQQSFIDECAEKLKFEFEIHGILGIGCDTLLAALPNVNDLLASYARGVVKAREKLSAIKALASNNNLGFVDELPAFTECIQDEFELAFSRFNTCADELSFVNLLAQCEVYSTVLMHMSPVTGVQCYRRVKSKLTA